ncbi:MAG: PocR ligand-binding domain-containing protein [Coriobacteriia bacterium]|nr:PocR ligand-binding domain-containing protein [Coriobacteriia bacterium]
MQSRPAPAGGTTDSLRADEILDIPAITGLMEAFFRVAELPAAMIDLDSRILVATGWQDVCARFHRVHPETLARCEESDRRTAAALKRGAFVLHKCWNNLYGTAAPLIVGDRHVANLFLGPFFLEDEPIEQATYREYALANGFDVDEYLTAIDDLPVISRHGLEDVTELYSRLIGMIGQLSYSNLELKSALEEHETRIALEQHTRSLEAVNALAVELVSAPSSASIQTLLCERIRELTGAVAVGYGDYEAASQELVTTHVAGDADLLGAAARLVGSGMRGFRAPCTPEQYHDIVDTPVRRMETLAAASHGAVAAGVAGPLQKLAGVDRFLSVGFVVEGELYGSAVVAMRAGTPDPPSGLLESLANIAAVSLRRRRAEEALRESQEYARALFSDSLVSLVVLEPASGRFLDCNDAAIRLWGCSSIDEIIGRSPADFSTPLQYDGTASADAAAERLKTCSEKGFAVYDWRHQRIDGTIRHCEVHLATIGHGGGRLVQASIQDVTERKNAEEDFRALNADLERRVNARTAELATTNAVLAAANAELSAMNADLDVATRAKSEFLASMSHELRTPLNSIIGFAGTLSQGLAGELNDEQARQARMIGSSGRHLLELINQILDLSRIEAGYPDMKPERFAVADVIAEAADSVSQMVDARGLVMTVRADGAGAMLADRGRVRQVILNLLGNAVKFTDEGAIDLSARRVDGHVELVVSDTGCGISAADLPHIFDDFFQATPRQGAKSLGTGLGLAVSRRLVEMMGGSIGAASTLGAGSTFTVRLPAEMDVPAEAPANV